MPTNQTQQAQAPSGDHVRDEVLTPSLTAIQQGGDYDHADQHNQAEETARAIDALIRARVEEALERISR